MPDPSDKKCASWRATGKGAPRWVSPFIVTVMFLGIWVAHRPGFWSPRMAPEDIRRLFPSAAELSPFETVVEVRDAEGVFLGWVGRTSADAERRLTGHAGPVPLLVGVDADGRVAGLVLLPNRETASFIDHLARHGAMDVWQGLDIDTALTKPVDTVSGATQSYRAIVGGVREVLSRMPEAAEIAVSGANGEQQGFPWAPELGVAVSIFALGHCFGTKYLKKTRPLLLVANLAILGFANGSLLSLAWFAGWLHSPRALLAAPLLTGIFIVSLVVGLGFGRNFYCLYICPYGCAQELVSSVSPLPKKQPPRRAILFLGVFRVSLLLVLAAALLFRQPVELSLIEPFAAFSFHVAPIGVVVLAIAFLLLSVRFPRLWCRALCPTGMLMKMLSPTLRRPQPSFHRVTAAGRPEGTP